MITENDPVSTDGKNRWQEAIDGWARNQVDEKYHYPTETSYASADSVIVSIKAPGNQVTIGSGNVNIQAKITSLAPLKNVKIYLNGSEIRNFNEDKKDIDETISLSDGVYEVRVTAVNDKDKSGDSSIKFGVNKPWDTTTPTPTPTVANFPTPTPTP